MSVKALQICHDLPPEIATCHACHGPAHGTSMHQPGPQKPPHLRAPVATLERSLALRSRSAADRGLWTHCTPSWGHALKLWNNHITDLFNLKTLRKYRKFMEIPGLRQERDELANNGMSHGQDIESLEVGQPWRDPEHWDCLLPKNPQTDICLVESWNKRFI